MTERFYLQKKLNTALAWQRSILKSFPKFYENYWQVCSCGQCPSITVLERTGVWVHTSHKEAYIWCHQLWIARLHEPTAPLPSPVWHCLGGDWCCVGWFLSCTYIRRLGLWCWLAELTGWMTISHTRRRFRSQYRLVLWHIVKLIPLWDLKQRTNHCPGRRRSKSPVIEWPKCLIWNLEKWREETQGHCLVWKWFTHRY